MPQDFPVKKPQDVEGGQTIHHPLEPKHLLGLLMIWSCGAMIVSLTLGHQLRASKNQALDYGADTAATAGVNETACIVTRYSEREIFSKTVFNYQAGIVSVHLQPPQDATAFETKKMADADAGTKAEVGQVFDAYLAQVPGCKAYRP